MKKTQDLNSQAITEKQNRGIRRSYPAKLYYKAEIIKTVNANCRQTYQINRTGIKLEANPNTYGN